MSLASLFSPHSSRYCEITDHILLKSTFLAGNCQGLLFPTFVICVGSVPDCDLKCKPQVYNSRKSSVCKLSVCKTCPAFKRPFYVTPQPRNSFLRNLPYHFFKTQRSLMEQSATALTMVFTSLTTTTPSVKVEKREC